MQVIEGKQSLVHERKENGRETREVAQFAGDGHSAVQASVVGAEMMSVSAGRTIELAPYEFARVDIGINVYFRDMELADKGRDACQAIVNEILAREEAMIAGSDRADKAIEWAFPEGFARSIYVSYGLTLKGQKRFESHRVDVSRLWQIDDGANLIGEIDKVSEWVVNAVKAKADEIKGSGSDTGI